MTFVDIIVEADSEKDLMRLLQKTLQNDNKGEKKVKYVIASNTIVYDHIPKRSFCYEFWGV